MITDLDMYVLRAPRLGDCTNGGVSSLNSMLTLIFDDEGDHSVGHSSAMSYCIKKNINPEEACFFSNHNSPRIGSDYQMAIPIVKTKMPYEVVVGSMMGGNYLTTSDSRKPAKYPIPIHDRWESRELYNKLSGGDY